MYLGNRKVDRSVARQRWLKYWVFILITSFIVCSIWFHFFLPVAILLVIAGYFELVRTIPLTRFAWIALTVYSLIVAGFFVFALDLKREFQFYIYLQILAFDAFSQVVGNWLAKQPLHQGSVLLKTLEGLIGGIVFCVLASCLMSSWMHLSLMQAILFGLFTAVTGLAGDMAASFTNAWLESKTTVICFRGKGASRQV